MTNSIVELSNITSGYEGRTVLQNLSLFVNKGELVLIEGATGAGKTTLLRLILAAQPYASGFAKVADINLQNLTDDIKTRLRRRIGTVFQTPRFLPIETVLTNVILPLSIAGFPIQECKAKGIKILMDYGLAAHAQKYPQDLSGGESARLQIARAVIHQPYLVLADEPFAHLDSDSAAEAEEFLSAVHQRGTTIVMTSHRSTELAKKARRLKLEEGKLV